MGLCLITVGYHQGQDNGWAGVAAALSAVKQKGKEWVQGGTSILWNVLTEGKGGTILDPCLGLWTTLSRYWVSWYMHNDQLEHEQFTKVAIKNLVTKR